MSSVSRSEQRGAAPSVVALMFALIAAIFAFQLNASMLSPALATMERELATTSAQIGMTQTAFFAAAALFSLFLPRWGDLVGRKKIMIGMLVITGVGCVLSALAPGVGTLGVGRVIQGVAGPVVPMALIMLRVQVPDNRSYAKLMAVLTSVNGGIAGVDALLGGWLAQNYGFRSVFWVMAVTCAVAVVGIWFGTVESQSGENTPMDWKGTAALVVVLGALYFAFDQAGKLADANWAIVIGLIVLAAVAFAVFWSIENRVAHPLVTTTYLKHRRTWGLLGTTLLTMTGVFAIMNGIVPNMAQDPDVGAGISAAEVSIWTLTPYAIAGLIMGPFSGQIAARIGFKRMLQIGHVLTIAGLVAIAYIAASPTRTSLLVVCIWVGISYAGIVNIMLNGLGVVLSPKDNQGYLPGMNSGAFNLGAGLSFALLMAIQTGVSMNGGASAGYLWAVLGGLVLVVLAFLMSFLIPNPEPGDEEASSATVEEKVA